MTSFDQNNLVPETRNAMADESSRRTLLISKNDFVVVDEDVIELPTLIKSMDASLNVACATIRSAKMLVKLIFAKPMRFAATKNPRICPTELKFRRESPSTVRTDVVAALPVEIEPAISRMCTVAPDANPEDVTATSCAVTLTKERTL